MLAKGASLTSLRIVSSHRSRCDRSCTGTDSRGIPLLSSIRSSIGQSHRRRSLFSKIFDVVGHVIILHVESVSSGMSRCQHVNNAPNQNPACLACWDLRARPSLSPCPSRTLHCFAKRRSRHYFRWVPLVFDRSCRQEVAGSAPSCHS